MRYHFTQNVPANILEKAQIANQLENVVSQETQLKVLSIVDNVQNMTQYRYGSAHYISFSRRRIAGMAVYANLAGRKFCHNQTTSLLSKMI